VLVAGLPADVGTNGTHSITDQASATVYALNSETVDLDAYVGQRVTVYGTLTPGGTSSDEAGFEGNGTLPSIDVTRIEPVDDSNPDPTTDTRATFDFELTVVGTPHEGATFFGAVPAEGCISVPLAGPDGDGVFIGSLDVPRFAPGPVPPPDAEPVSLPVQIIQADSGASPCNPTTVIRDFGTVLANDGTFRASTSFEGNGDGATTPESENGGGTDDSEGPGSGSSDNGGSGDSGSSSGSNSGGSDSGSSGNDAASGESPSGVTSGITGLLPSTGGEVALWVLGAGILLIGGGLLVRKLAR
jgi:LPXTG-motif cell wall-anchored protein